MCASILRINRALSPCSLSIKSCYAATLWRLELDVVSTPLLQAATNKADLAALIGIPSDLLTKRAFVITQSILYTQTLHRKRNGNVRVVHAPLWPLKFIQKRISELLEEIYKPSSRANGFIKQRGIRRNASAHAGKRLILNVDIADYFASIHFGRIRGRLMAAPYNLTTDVATTIARLCTLDGNLPIGSPSSPILANIVSSKLDYVLTVLARERGCFYTRYADYITFSTDRRRFPSDLVELPLGQTSGRATAGSSLLEAFHSNGFLLNEQKTRVLGPNDSQEVCGVICNRGLSPRKPLRRKIRAMLHAWRKFGRGEAEREWKEKFNWRGASSFERSLRGRIEFFIHIRGDDDSTVQKIVDQYNALPDRLLKAITYNYVGGWKDNLKKRVCVVEAGDDDALEYKQGTGFVISEGYILTNAHVVVHEGNALPQIAIRFPGHLLVDIDAEIVHLDQSRDFAVLKPKDDDWRLALSKSHVELDFSPVSNESYVWIAGFPSYHVGDECGLVIGHVTGKTVQENIPYFRVSQVIVKGNSGGPVFNSDGKVVGIATRGIDTHDVPNVLHNGCLYLSSFTDVLLGLEQSNPPALSS